jgi:hypothetical protein
MTRTASFAAILVAAATFSPTFAHADDREQCVAASEAAQKLVSDHKLIEARQQFILCAKESCPNVVKKDCIEQLDAVTKKIPSIVVRAKGPSGDDLAAVRVNLDGTRVADTLDGSPVQLDPGAHSIRLEAEGQAPVEQQLIIAEGEQNRVINLAFGAKSGGIAAPAPSVGGGHSFPSWPALVAGGVSVVSFAIFAGAGIAGMGDYNACKDAKAKGSPCTDAKIDSIGSTLTMADVFLVVGIGTAVTSGVLLAIHLASGPSQESKPAPQAGFLRSVRPSAAPLPGGGWAGLSASF